MTREAMRDRLWDMMVRDGVATENELTLVSHLMGFTLETMEAVLFERTGYRDLDQYEDRPFE